MNNIMFFLILCLKSYENGLRVYGYIILSEIGERNLNLLKWLKINLKQETKYL